MKNYTKATVVLTLGSFLLTGCATIIDDDDTRLIEKQRLEQLSTLVAGSNYLRDHCQRNDVPPTNKLARTALTLAKQKSWRMRSGSRDIENRSEEILKDLNQDGAPVVEKCAFFDKSLSAFIEQSKNQ